MFNHRDNEESKDNNNKTKQLEKNGRNHMSVYNPGVSPILREAVASVFNQLGFGLSEHTYRKALTSELRCFYEHIEEEYSVPLSFTTTKGQKFQLAILRCDIIIKFGMDCIVLELKTGAKPLKDDCKEKIQMLRYQRIMNAHECYLINFHKDGYQIL